MRPLKPEEMCEEGNAVCIARRLASFHAVNVQGISKEPQVFQRILTWYFKNYMLLSTHLPAVHCITIVTVPFLLLYY